MHRDIIMNRFSYWGERGCEALSSTISDWRWRPRHWVQRYAPAAGMTAHVALAFSIMNPRSVARIFPRHNITNTLLLTSFAGTSVWLWRRPHINGTTPSRRFPWVFLGSSTFVLGSVLMWALIRSAVGRDPYVSVFLGLTSGAALTYTAVDYFKYIDKDFDPLDDISNISDDEEKLSINSDDNNF